MIRYLLLIFWIVVIIFPSTAYLERAPSGSLLNLAYASEAAHVITHIIVYAVLVLLLLRSFQLSLNKKSALTILLVVLVVGLLQEGLQFIVSEDRIFGWPELFDLGVDVVGGLIGLGIWRMSKKRNDFRGTKGGIRAKGAKLILKPVEAQRAAHLFA